MNDARYFLNHPEDAAKGLGQFSLAVRSLNSIVRPIHITEIGGSAHQQAEYALSLMRLGGRKEASTILENINSKEYPPVDLYRAWDCALRGDFGASIPHFKNYLAWKEAPAHQRLVARVNLCEALVAEEQFSDPELKLAELIKVTRENQHPLLCTHLHELCAQVCISKVDYEGALRWLENAEKEILASDRITGLILKKWRMVVELAINQNSTAGRIQNEEVKTEALRLKHWETVRDCDRILAVWAGDITAADRVFFGTPCEAYRKRFIHQMGGRYSPAPFFDAKLGGDHSYSPLFHLATGQLIESAKPDSRGAAAKVKVGQAVYRFLNAVASDHYRPVPLVGIFSAIYPDENFHPLTSPMRVHRVIQRFREWVKEANLPLEIGYQDDGYSLVASGPVVLRHEVNSTTLSREQVWAGRVRELSHSQSFSRADVEKWLGVSQTSAHRFLKQASADGYFAASGSGNSKRYVWLTQKKMAA